MFSVPCCFLFFPFRHLLLAQQHKETIFVFYRVGKFQMELLLTQSRLGCGRGHTWVNYRGEEGHGAHDRVSCLAERYRLVGKWAQGRRTVLQVRVFNGQPQEVQDTLILRSAAHVFGHFVPVVLIHFQTLREVTPTFSSIFPWWHFPVWYYSGCFYTLWSCLKHWLSVPQVVVVFLALSTPSWSWLHSCSAHKTSPSPC